MFKFVALALVLSCCNAQQVILKDAILRDGIIGDPSQYVLVNNVAQPHIAIRHNVAPIARVLSGPKIVAPQVYGAHHVVAPQTLVAPNVVAPRVVAHRPVVYNANKIITRSDEVYGPPEPYSFGYQSTDEFGTTLHRSESADGTGAVTGSYSYTDANGQTRHVEYVADAAGYRAAIKTNEPGTANANPADVQMVSDEPSAQIQQSIAAYSVPAVRAVKTVKAIRV